MVENRTMEELLQAPTEGYEEAIIIPEINADHFEIKTNLLQLVQANPFHGFERENPHTHINNFKRITSTLKFKDVSNDVIKLMMFPYSLEGATRVWYDKEPPNSILTWDDLLTQIDTFYNGLNENDQDSLNAAAGGNLLSKTTREALNIIENKSKVRYSRNKPNVSRMNTTSRESSGKTDDRIDKLADQISTLVEIVTKKVVTPATVKAVEESCEICGGAHAYYDCIATDSNQSSIYTATGIYNQVAPPNRASNQMAPPGFAPMQNNQNRFNQNQGNNFNQGNSFHGSFFQNQASTSGTLLSNTIPNPKVKRETEETMDKEQTNFQGSTAHIQPPIIPIPIPEPDVPKTLPKPNIPYPSRLNDQKLHEKATNQMEKFFQIFQDLHFDISFADALILMPKFASTIKILLTNKDKLFELAKIPLNENCSVMLLKKLPEKLGDPGKFLIPCDFSGIDVCHALADLGASINLMPLSIWKKLSLPELTPTRMTLELADRSITRPKGVAEDVFVKVGKFHFPTDFIVVDFDADPRVPLIFGRSFLTTDRALIDVYGEEITLRVNDEAYAQEVLGFSNNFMGVNPTPTFEPIISDSSSSFTPFEGSDFILEEIETYLKHDSISPEIDHADFDPEGDICLIEKLLNNDPFQLSPMDIKQAEVTKAKSSIEETPELELKDLPSHLEYAYLEGTDKLPMIITKNLKDNEKEALLKVLKSHKQAIAWKITDIKGIDPWCMMAIFHDMIEKTMEVFMDDFSVFGDSFASCLSNLEKMLKMCEDMNLVLNWEKCHFMCKEGIVLGHKISKSGIEVDRAKVDVIAKLPHPTTVKGVRSFLGHAGFYRRFIQDFSKIARPMTHLLKKDAPFVFSQDCIDAFETLKKKLTEAPILVVPDWNLPFELMCDASDFAIGAVLGQRKTKHFQPIHYASKTMTEA
ncbi:reverse transcriptase domain-containing protein [Tanacetum coccineum]